MDNKWSDLRVVGYYPIGKTTHYFQNMSSLGNAVLISKRILVNCKIYNMYRIMLCIIYGAVRKSIFLKSLKELYVRNLF